MRTYIELCCERAEAAEANADRAEDAVAKRIWWAAASKWREIAQNAICNQVSHDRWVASGVISGNAATATPGVSPVPRPSSLSLFASGFGALGLLGWRRER